MIPRSNRKRRLFMDVDADSKWLWRTGPLWDDLLPLVKMEARRLATLYPLGDIAVIKRADDGWHLKFPQARLSQEEEIAIMWNTHGHFGHIAFSQLIGDSVLRLEPKPVKGSHTPYLVEVMKLDEGEGGEEDREI